ncbi:peptidyl-prolyl cis-trans isomerase [Thauera terpenica 58Eu]|jgi:peptidyl-prolyl cis-trans isomerase A (cyclophilin A)|uniref:Peptidyl-prolyl cis-trans isomerase n=1 Tax=Thauera terpenica 58Eu TaxID=1348657 RepID=S9ZGN9_9RHOO|nr:peptidylprolyl isomerase [Thauera terpenica]EPZ13756.1 peptidyl-prolyl cis-trans isomerase [Thauera terpenica 58Eu]
MKKHLIAFALLASSALSALAANPMVELKTNQGDIVVEVFADKAPKSADNFIQYVKDGFYNRTVFHRVIDGFMIQGGGFDADMKQKSTRAPIENEARNGLRNEVGTLAMARTADPHSASSQFFINLVANTALDYPSRDGWGYAVFGKVVKGLEVVESIAKQPTANRGFHQNVPVEAVIVNSARVLEASAEKRGAK